MIWNKFVKKIFCQDPSKGPRGQKHPKKGHFGDFSSFYIKTNLKTNFCMGLYPTKSLKDNLAIILSENSATVAPDTKSFSKRTRLFIKTRILIFNIKGPFLYKIRNLVFKFSPKIANRSMVWGRDGRPDASYLMQRQNNFKTYYTLKGTTKRMFGPIIFLISFFFV